jgi:hypothetical protein
MIAEFLFIGGDIILLECPGVDQVLSYRGKIVLRKNLASGSRCRII